FSSGGHAQGPPRARPERLAAGLAGKTPGRQHRQETGQGVRRPLEKAGQEPSRHALGAAGQARPPDDAGAGMETDQVKTNHESTKRANPKSEIRNPKSAPGFGFRISDFGFRMCVFVLLPVLILAAPVFGVIERIYPLKAVLDDAQLIFTVTVDKLDPDKPSVVFLVEDDLKGKTPFRKLAVNLTGDAEAKKGKQTPQLLKRLAPKLQLVIFAVKNGTDCVGCGYSNAPWFQLRGQKGAGAAIRWSFNHFEPYLRRTFKGTTKELKQVVVDGLAGTKQPPEPDKKEKPGIGPEVKQAN